MNKGEKPLPMERLLNIKDAALFLNVSEMTIRRWTNSGKLTCHRVGGKRERRFYMRDLEAFLHDKGLPMKPLGLEGQSVPEGSHMTHFYRSKAEAHGLSIPYLLEGIRRKEALLAVMPPDRSRELIEIVKRRGHPVENWLESGLLHVSAGMDSPEQMIRFLGEFAARTREFRLLGDMMWTVDRGWDPATLSAFERSPAFMPPVEKGLLLCQYGLEDFTGAAVMMAAEAHRQIIYKGRLKKSPYYMRDTKDQGD
jgi:excisionase family DNA binding protein